MTTPYQAYQSMQTPLTYASSSSYTNYIQQQQQSIASMFASATLALQHDIVSNVLDAVNSDKNRKENLIMIAICKLMEKNHCNGTLLRDIIDNKEQELKENNEKKERSMDTLINIQDRLLNIEKLLTMNATKSTAADEYKKTIKAINISNNKLKSLENILLNIKQQINNNTTALSTFDKKIEAIKLHNNDVVIKLDKKIDNLNTEQIKFNKSIKSVQVIQHTTQKQMLRLNQTLKDNNNEIMDGMMSHSVAIQSIRSHIDDISTQHKSSLPTTQLISKLNAPTTNVATHVAVSTQTVYKNGAPSTNASISTEFNSTTPIHQLPTVETLKSTSYTDNTPTTANAETIKSKYFAHHKTVNTPKPSLLPATWNFRGFYENLMPNPVKPNIDNDLINVGFLRAKLRSDAFGLNIKTLARNPFSKPSSNTHTIELAAQHKKTGNMYYNKKQFEDAINYYKKAQKLDQLNGIYVLNESAALFMLQKWSETIICCKKVLTLTEEPELRYKAYKRLGLVEERLKNLKESLFFYFKALQLKYDITLAEKIMDTYNLLKSMGHDLSQYEIHKYI